MGNLGNLLSISRPSDNAIKPDMPLETFWYYQNESLLLMHLVQNFSFVIKA